jgi:hypothetical protein
MMRAAPINTTISNGMTFASSLSCLSLSVAICFPQGTRPQNKPQLLNLSLFLASVGGLPSSEKPLPFCACRNWSRRRGPAFHKNKTGPPVGRAGVRSPLGLPIQVNREARPSERQIIIRACRAQCVASPSFPRNFTGYTRSSGDPQLPQAHKLGHVDILCDEIWLYLTAHTGELWVKSLFRV